MPFAAVTCKHLSNYPDGARMATDSTTQLQGLIDRLIAGDSSARDEVIARAYARLRVLAHKMLKRFPDVRSVEDTDDLLHDSFPRLLRAVETVSPPAVAEFFGLASRQMRWELLDLVGRCKGPAAAWGRSAGGDGDRSTSDPRGDVPGTTDNPVMLATWSEFHKRVETLPEKEREVFELLWYQEMTQPDAARILQIAESTVRRHWLSARRQLGKFLRSGESD